MSMVESINGEIARLEAESNELERQQSAAVAQLADSPSEALGRVLTAQIAQRGAKIDGLKAQIAKLESRRAEAEIEDRIEQAQTDEAEAHTAYYNELRDQEQEQYAALHRLHDDQRQRLAALLAELQRERAEAAAPLIALQKQTHEQYWADRERGIYRDLSPRYKDQKCEDFLGVMTKFYNRAVKLS